VLQDVRHRRARHAGVLARRLPAFGVVEDRSKGDDPVKVCPACAQQFDDENVVCPTDSNLLEAASAATVAAAAEPADPRRVNTGDLVHAALGALEGQRTSEREAALARMHQLERYNTYCHAAWRFVYDLTSHSDLFGYSVHNMDEESRMWVTCTLAVGTGRQMRRFPIRVSYHRELGHDVTLEIDLEEIGTTREEQIERTELAGGRATSTRFGWSFVVHAPRTLDDEASVLDWLRQAFMSILRLAYGAPVVAQSAPEDEPPS
jgi:hypothetical protein